jgi:hypothetical protein
MPANLTESSVLVRPNLSLPFNGKVAILTKHRVVAGFNVQSLPANQREKEET